MNPSTQHVTDTAFPFFFLDALRNVASTTASEPLIAFAMSLVLSRLSFITKSKTLTV